MLSYKPRTLLVVLVIAPMVLAYGQDGTDQGESIYGDWEMVGMIFKGVVQDLIGSGFITIKKDTFQLSYNSEPGGVKYPCTIRRGEMDIQHREGMLKALYRLNEGELRIIWRNNYGARPTDFDALKDPGLTLYVLRKKATK